MYPGTYQPLQAMALLLADLLSFPHSDEAPTTQGLVDAIFDLYQIDQGMITGTDPPRRKLSLLGKEAWSMLGRIRKRALEQMDQDPHVVLPSSMSSSNVCICGERIVHERLLRNEEEQPEMPPWEATNPDLEPTVRQDTPIGDAGPGQSGFDWDEWDAYLGNSTGTMI